MNNLIDKHGRAVNYIRVSITDRCNFRCFYCKPIKEFKYIPHSEILRFEDLLFLINTLGEYGVKNIKITGGEPFIKKGFIDFLKKLKNFSVSITSNGFLIHNFIDELKDSGIKKINISLDTLSKKRFKEITGVDAFNTVFRNILLLKRNEFFVKINSVIMKSTINEAEALINFSSKNKIPIRFIELMPISKEIMDEFISEKIFKEIVMKKFTLIPYNETLGSGPARYYKIKENSAIVGFISSLTHNFCETCNKIRITPDGKLRVCLALDDEMDLKEPIKKRNKEKLIEMIKFALSKKPFKHKMEIKSRVSKRSMIQIGG